MFLGSKFKKCTNLLRILAYLGLKGLQSLKQKIFMKKIQISDFSEVL